MVQAKTVPDHDIRINQRPIRRICVQADDGRELELSELMWLSREDPESAPPLKQGDEAA